MAYKVIKLFTDLKDGGHRYNVGDPYPRKGVEVSGERVAALRSGNNKQGVPLIEEVATSQEDVETPKPKAPRKKKSEE